MDYTWFYRDGLVFILFQEIIDPVIAPPCQLRNGIENEKKRNATNGFPNQESGSEYQFGYGNSNFVRETNRLSRFLYSSAIRFVLLFSFRYFGPVGLGAEPTRFCYRVFTGFYRVFFSWDDCFQFPLVVVVVVVEDIEDVAVTRFFVSLLTWLSTGALPSWKKNWNSAITRPSIVFFTSFSAHAIVLLQD